jgi:hypothetical protein
LNTSDFNNGQFTVHGSVGTPGWDYVVLTSTNFALPFGQWTRVATNQFSAQGDFAFAVPVNPAAPQMYYRIHVP